MKLAIVAPFGTRSGATLVAERLARMLGAAKVSSVDPPLQLLHSVLGIRADVVLVEFEYATFKGVPRSLLLLPIVTLLLRARCKVVVKLHGVVTEESLRGLRFSRLTLHAYRTSYKLTAIFASAFFVQSDLMKTTLRDDYGITAVYVIPFPSDVVGPATASPNQIAFLGYVRPTKGIEPLIDAIALLRADYPDLRLVIAGPVLPKEGWYFETVRQALRRMAVEDRVTLLTHFLAGEEKSAVVRASRILLLPYTDRFVEISGVLHDFAGFGVPVICSDRPRFSELTDGVNCLKVPPTGPRLADAIRTLLKDPTLSSRLAEGLRKKALAETWDIVVARHRELFEDVLGSRGKH